MGNITNEDNLQLMARYPDNHFDLAIVDPPYGIDGDSHRKNTSRGKHIKSKAYHNALWKQNIPPEKYFKELTRVSKNQIIFGINYFKSPSLKSGGRIVWDKVNGDNHFSDAEIAYCSLFDSVRVVHYMWSGMMQGDNISRAGSTMRGNKALNEKRIHPTQKPIKLYEWLLIKYGNEGDKILDTHLGSGSIAIACHKLKFDLTACELDPVYYSDAVRRIKEFKSQLTLF